LSAILAVSVWLGASAFFVATFVSELAPLVLQVEGWPTLAATVVVIVLANRAIASSGLRGKQVLAFYRNKPSWVFIVQLIMLALMPVLAASGPSGRTSGGVCAISVNGERVELSPADCQKMRVQTLRFFADTWMTLAWLALAQFALTRKGTRVVGSHSAGRSA
jgi:hypothetical protein